MARYLVQARHTPQDCLQALDDIVALGPNEIDRYDFGCAAGDHSNHVCFCSTEADSETAVRASLPGSIRDQAQIIEVGKFTVEQIKAFHGA